MPHRRRIAGAASVLLVAMVISRILGYVRDVIIYARFGQNNITDAYQAAFSIPDFLYLLLVGGALASAFIPVFGGYLATEQEEEAWKVASVIYSLVGLLMLAGATLGIIFAPQLMRLLVPGFDPPTMQLAVSLTRIIFIQAFFMAISGVTMGILHSYQYFTATAAAAVLYNLAIIVVGYFLSPYVGIKAFALGVVVGAISNVLVQLPALRRHGFRYRFSLNVGHPGVKRLWLLMMPILVSLSVTQFNLFVNQNLASHLTPGVVAALRTAQQLMQLPVGTFAVALAVATFPNLTAQAARGELDEYRSTLSLSLRSMVFIMLPSALGLIALRAPIIRLLFEQGKFTPESTQATAAALLFYAVGVVAYGSIQLLNRAFYAVQNTAMPMLSGLLTIGLNVWLNITLVRYLGHGGLALAYSLAGVFNMTVLLFLLRRRVGPIGGRRLLLSAVKTALAAVPAGGAAYLVAVRLESVAAAGKLGQVEQVGTAVVVAGLVFVLVALALRMEEMGAAWQMARRRLGIGGQA